MMPVRRSNQTWLPSIFNDFFDNDWMVKANATAPAINVIESDKDYKVEVAAPGMTKEDFKIHINEDNDLVISMEKKTEKEEKYMKELQDRYIRFDWAIKRLLRQKANFGVLEGFLTVFLGEQIKIEEILESEGNQQDADDKFNRVDIKAKNTKGDIILIEIQNTRELYYLERVLYSVAKAVTEHLHLGQDYSGVKKIYSISILYFDIGVGTDYLYHG